MSFLPPGVRDARRFLGSQVAPVCIGLSFVPAIAVAIYIVGAPTEQERKDQAYRRIRGSCEEVAAYARANPGQGLVPDDVLARCAPVLAWNLENKKMEVMRDISRIREWLPDHHRTHSADTDGEPRL